MKQKPFVVEDIEGEMSFIHAKEAGKFLAWLNTVDIRGPINACSNGVITMQEVIHFIEENTGVKAIVQETGENIAPYNGLTNCTVDNTRAEALGFQFRELKGDIYSLLEKYINVI